MIFMSRTFIELEMNSDIQHYKLINPAALTCSNSAIETLGQDVKHVQS